MTAMPTHLVNLDALIQREDFESGKAESGSHEPLFKLEELAKDKLYYKVLRKPDFQRGTSNWDAKTIVEFVRSFLDGELIPALILWQSRDSNKVFVIDGAHRLSSLIAWVNDDYGDGVISRAFFNHKVPAAQQRFHAETKQQIEESVGSFQRLLHVGLHPEQKRNDTEVKRARAIATRQPPIQKVEGDATIAEQSFFKINNRPTTIDPIDLEIIKARLKPNAIATRALMRAGTGHRYWGRLERAAEIEALASEVYQLIFGQFVELGTQSPDVPQAGQPYSDEAFRLVFDMVNELNGITPAMWQVRDENDQKPSRRVPVVPVLPDETDGSRTIGFLENIRDAASLVIGSPKKYPGSLGLDQAVYSYGDTAKFHPAAFLASIRFAQQLRDRDKLRQFTDNRATFEDFLVNHKWIINALGHSKGSRTRALEPLLLMLWTAFSAIQSGASDEAGILAALQAEEPLKDLRKPERKRSTSGRMSKTAKAVAVINQILENRERCKECGARMPPSSRSNDHIIREADGGSGDSDNIQFLHPYCNSAQKERRIHEARTKPATARTTEAP